MCVCVCVRVYMHIHIYAHLLDSESYGEECQEKPDAENSESSERTFTDEKDGSAVGLCISS